MNKKKLTLLILLALLFTSASRCVAGAIHTVTDTQSIQSTIKQAEAGDTVIISEGEYVENITISKPIALRAAPDAKSVLIVAKDSTLPVIRVAAASNSSIEGINVKGSTKEAGILVLNSTGVSIAGCVATENRIGIALIGSDSNTIIGNTTEYNETYGIYLERSSGNILSGNSSGQNFDKGIFLSYANDNLITENSTNHNKWNGILLWDSHNNRITNNKAYRNMYSIIESESSGNLYSDNSTLPNLYIILPIIMIYTGIIFYLIQRLIIGKILSATGKKK